MNLFELEGVMLHEIKHSFIGGEPCLDWIFSQIPDSFREQALRLTFEFSVEKMSDQILSEAINAGLLNVPGFMDDVEAALLIRDRLFSSASPNLVTGHIDLLRSFATNLGRDFQLSSIRAAFSPFHADKIGAHLHFDPDATRRVEIATENLKCCLSFCPKEFTLDPAIGNAVVGTFMHHGYHSVAGFDVSDQAMDDHIELMSKFNITDFAALESIIRKDELARMHTLYGQFLEVLDDRIKTGFGPSEIYAIGCGFKYAAQPFIEKMGELSDSQLRNLVTADFLEAYLKTDWISDTNMHLIKDPDFYSQLLALNERFMADPYIKVMLRDCGDGEILLPQLISADDFEQRVGVKYKPKYNHSALVVFCDMLEKIAEIPHLSGVHQSACTMAMRSFETAPAFYKAFFAEGKDLKDPETMSEAELVRASVCLIGAVFNYPKIGPLYKLVGQQREFQFKQPGREVPLNYLIKQIPSAEVIDYLQEVDGLIEALLEAKVLGRECIPELGFNRRGKIFRDELNI
jgi:hypothetical protein